MSNYSYFHAVLSLLDFFQSVSSAFGVENF